MANIESKLSTIRSASGGEDVRDAIIGALRDINNDVPADMSNPEHIIIDMPAGSDRTIPYDPPKLISEIYVKQPNTGGKTMTTPDVTITRNGEYPTDDEDYDPDKEIRLYSKVTVKVPQLNNAIKMETVEITQNGPYDATEWGVDGLRSINVNVSGASGEGPFKVEFYDFDRSTIINTQLVDKGGFAQCTLLDGKTYQGQYFKGWNPRPDNVTRDMKCYPSVGSSIIDPGETRDTWDVICADCGAHYPIGTYATLEVDSIPTMPVPPEGWIFENVIHDTNGDLIDKVVCRGPADGVSCSPFAFHMVKVAEGESGSTSTWISTGALQIHQAVWNRTDNQVIAEGCIGFKGVYGPNLGNLRAYYQGWGGSNLQTYLNNHFLSALPDALKRTIKTVTKSSTTFALAPVIKDPVPTKVERTSLDKIWPLSLKELHTLLVGQPSVLGEVYEEIDGIDYSTVYQPCYSNTGISTQEGVCVTLRSAGLWNASSLRQASIAYVQNSTELAGTAANAVEAIPFGFCL